MTFVLFLCFFFFTANGIIGGNGTVLLTSDHVQFNKSTSIRSKLVQLFEGYNLISSQCSQEILKIAGSHNREKESTYEYFGTALVATEIGALSRGVNYKPNRVSSCYSFVLPGDESTFYAVSFRKYLPKDEADIMVTVSVCLPKCCSEKDATNLTLNYLIGGTEGNISFTIVESKFVANMGRLPVTPLTLILCIINLVCLAVYIAGTCWSIMTNRKCAAFQLKKNYGNFPQEGTMQLDDSKMFDCVLKCYDLKANIVDIISRKEDGNDFRQIYGIRSLSMVYIACVNGAFYLCYRADDNEGHYSTHAFFEQMFKSFSLGSDTFFTVSGFLLSYNFFRREKERGKKGMKIPAAGHQIKYWLQEIGRRYFKHFKTAVAVLTMAFCACITLSGINTLYMDSTNNINKTIKFETAYSFHNPMFVHFGAYLSGLFLGYFIVILNGRWIQIQKSMLVLCWTSCAVINLTTLSSLAHGYIAPGVPSLYMLFSSSAWGVAVSWILCACFNENAGVLNNLLSFDIWRVTSKLSLMVYLGSPTLLYVFYHAVRVKWKIAPVYLVLYGAAFLVFCYAVAYILTLFYEMPLRKLEKYLLTPKPPRKSGEKLNLVSERY